jgi:hypothetical protein
VVVDEVERTVPYRDQPEFVFVLQPHPDGGVVLLASRTPIGPARLHEEWFRSSGERCSLTVDLGDWVKIMAPDYNRAFADLFKLWGDSPFASRTAVDVAEG